MNRKASKALKYLLNETRLARVYCCLYIYLGEKPDLEFEAKPNSKDVPRLQLGKIKCSKAQVIYIH